MATFVISFLEKNKPDEEVEAYAMADHSPFVDFLEGDGRSIVARYRQEQIERIVRKT